MPYHSPIPHNKLEDPVFMRSLYNRALASLCYSDEEYLAHNPDAASTSLPPFWHCCLKATAEGRHVSPFFSPRWYQGHYLSSMRDCNPVAHFFTYGVLNGLKGTDDAYTPHYLSAWENNYFDRMEVAPFTDWPWQDERATREVDPANAVHMLFVLHETTRTGAPLCALNAMKELARREGVVLWSLIMRKGPLETAFRSISRTLYWQDMLMAARLPQFGIMQLARGFAALPGKAKCLVPNTITVPKYVSTLFNLAGVPSLPWVHELPQQALWYCEKEDIVDLYKEVTAVLFPSHYCAAAHKEFLTTDTGGKGTPPQFKVIGGAIQANPLRFSNKQAGEFKRSLGIAEQASIVLGCGVICLLKGVDIFTEAACAMARIRSDVVFVWVGGTQTEKDVELLEQCRRTAAEKGAKLIFTGETPSLWPFYAASSVFLFSSRSDSNGMVVLEAKTAGLPVICFAESGGPPEQVDPKEDAVLPLGDSAALLEALLQRLPEEERDPFLPTPPRVPPFPSGKVADEIWDTLVRCILPGTREAP